MKRNLFSLVALVFLLSCHQDSDEVITIIENPDPPAVLITTRLVSILDNAPIDASAVQLTFAGQTGTFDDVDFYQIKGSGINRDYELIRMTLELNLPLYKAASLTANDVNYVHLTIPDLQVFDGLSTTESVFPVSAGVELKVPAESLSLPDGTAYQGTYKIAVASLNPGGGNANCFPSFSALSNQNILSSLVFEACYYIAAVTPDGVVLKFSNAAFLSMPSSELPVWVFDVQKGIWAPGKDSGLNQDEKIYLDASGYYARAEASPLTHVKGTLKINGSLTPHFPLTIRYAGQERVVHTTNNGAWAIQLPSATACQISIQFPCGDTQDLALMTNAESEMVTALEITNDEIENVLIKGTARDCNANPLEGSFTIVEGITETLLFSDHPEINTYIPACINGALTISSYNPVDEETGPSVTWLAADTINIHSSFACHQAMNEYLSLMVSGEKKMYWALKSELQGDRLIIEDDGSIPDLDFKVFVEGQTEGLYDDTMLNILFEDMNLGTRGYSLYCPTATSGCGFTEFTITHFAEAEGQWIRGHFEGKFWIKTFNPLTAGYRTVAGEFQVYREF
ncbi:MAG TPA: hypothetical protein VLA46_12875 [Saprospiraceae bacterium]|nr:hypothetical protein [Saprospiraceae bacterium]